jgi:hypothetical protein
MIPCLQSTSGLSETIAHLGINGSWYRPQTVSVGLRCGQEWWSGFFLGRKNTVKLRLTAVSSFRSHGLPMVLNTSFVRREVHRNQHQWPRDHRRAAGFQQCWDEWPRGPRQPAVL